MTELNPQVKQIRVPTSVWAIAFHIVKSGKDTFSQRELEGASCGNLSSALAEGLIERLNNGLYKANIELAKFYASLLPRVPRAYVVDRKGRFSVSETKISCEERKEAVRLARAWAKLANWAEVHAEDSENPPRDIVEVLERHGITVRRMVLPSGTKAVVAKVLNYYIIMDSLMVKNSPKCVRFPKLGDAWLCASTREKLYWYLVPLTLRPQN